MLLLLIIVPFLTSYLLRVLAWKVILGDSGRDQLVPLSLHRATGRRPGRLAALQPVRGDARARLRVDPVRRAADLRGLDNLDRSLLEAAGDLGASRWRTFVRVTLPLSLSGVFAAFVFVFIPTIGEFVTPLLVGGPSGYMYGNAMQDLFTRGLDWQTGSVLAMFLLPSSPC